LVWYAVVGLFRSQAALQAEILILRYQLNVLRRKSPKRVALTNIDRLLFAGLCGLAPKAIEALFLRNHAGGIASIDLFVVPTISFRLLY
jgi:hypothetical protein